MSKESKTIPTVFSSFIERAEHSWAMQDEVEKFGVPFPKRSIEKFLSNEYYGLDLIVKGFIKIDLQKSLRFGVPHGVEVGDDFIGNVYGFGTVLSTLTYNNVIGLTNMIKHRVPGWRIFAEHPILLLRDIYLELGLSSDRQIKRNVLFFPAHLDVTEDFENSEYDNYICNKLLEIGKIEGQIDVSLPGIDIFLKRHHIYQSAGLRVVSSGHIHDPYFLSRFSNIVANYRKICTSEIGSHVFYASALGCKTEFWDLGLPYIQALAVERRRQFPYEVNEKVKRLFFHKSLLSQQVAEKLLGWNGSRPSRDRWKQIYHLALLTDHIGILEPVGNGMKLAVPRSTRRLIKSMLLKLTRSQL